MEGFVVPVILMGNLALYGGYVWGSRWAMEALDRAGKDRKCAMQCSLADILCLFVPAQLALGAVHWVMRHAETLTKEWEWDLAIVIAMPLIWWDLVLKLSRADVHVAWQRCIVLMVAPLVVLVGLATCGPPFCMLDLAWKHPVLAIPAMFLVAAVFGSAIYGLRRFTQAIVGAEMPPDGVGEADGAADVQESNSRSVARNDRQRPWRNRRQ